MALTARGSGPPGEMLVGRLRSSGSGWVGRWVWHRSHRWAIERLPTPWAEESLEATTKLGKRLGGASHTGTLAHSMRTLLLLLYVTFRRTLVASRMDACGQPNERQRYSER